MSTNDTHIHGQKKRVIIAGGGTGGHIFPAIAIANALKQLDAGMDILFVGAKGKMEMEKIPQAGYEIKGLDIAGFNRSALWKNAGLPFKLIKSYFQVRKIFRDFPPDAVVGVGGYSTYPVLRLAQSRNIPSFIHESNSFAGKANTMLGKKATRIFVATGGMEKFFPPEKIVISGNPVRKSIVEATVSRAEALSFFGLDPSRTTILAVGGSLGARSINAAIASHIDAFAAANLQLIWQTGKTTAAEYIAKGKGHANIWVNDFITDMEKAYAAADIVVSRAGAMAVAEVCVVAKPAVFVPFPLAAEDHQTANAMSLVNKQAALIVKDSDAKNSLVKTVIALAADKAAQTQLHEKIKPLGIRNADTLVAEEILKTVHG
ncbi:undecaprenyldiphospho-muramoylpentapeptide beta-N-acetylglucosaminyltransferase [Sediminibacterium soli]|uniref:undecaprenyldiphospho-muramoylpentapeptide beta-N-acetylglucosaminyltransferase n=1 Tax=Sediminibacterium soli TaxID=2698829 RepID=UPI00137B1677|nr:undecaprenyldiphospho-muramoylpentapeptide beta-N-acetylglucosaminyltransferase [Sediminibacterium soli]NCI48027.1 undecaprenyldiphospho-muramoylpentapeptide beta-N-acetylglucosaminyltransferase [Sediminibacterium soli]